MRYLMGIDLGTTSIKSVIFDQRGNQKALSTTEYSHLVDPSKRTVELDINDLWKALRRSVRQALREFRQRPSDIISLAISGQGDTFLVLDERFRPLSNAITYLDSRSFTQCKSIEKEFGASLIFRVTGQPKVTPIYPATKILWIRENQPEVFRKAAMYAAIEDYIVHRLTGTFVCDYSCASMTLAFDIREKKWWSELLEFLNINEDQLPEPKPSGHPIENVTQKASEETGLSTKTLVSMGAHDHAAAALGAGNIVPGIVAESTGAVLGLTTTVDNPIYDQRDLILCNCHAAENKYLLLLVGKTGGMVLRWFRDEFCQSEINEARRKRTNVYELLTTGASKIQPGSEGLIIIPHLMGAGTPENDPNAKGVFFGLTLGHSKRHMIRGIMESVAFMLRRNIELLNKSGIRTEEIRSIGGGARSQLWNQIKADVTQTRVMTLKTEEAASLGAAILGGVSSRTFSSLADACQVMVKPGKRYTPNSENKSVYDDRYGRYVELYERLKDLF